jgi:hypothetical protein
MRATTGDPVVKFFNFFLSGVAALALSGVASAASATVIYDNLSPGEGVNAGSSGISSAATGPLADSFSTGADAAYLTDIKLLVGASDPNDNSGFFAAVYTDNSDTVGSFLGVVGAVPDSSLTTSLTTLDLPQGPGEFLAANSRYWLVLINPFGPTSALWGYDATNTGIGTANEFNYYNGTYYANNAGGIATPYQMQVSVTNVPEPATWLLTIAGVFGLGSALRVARRRSPAAALA